MGEDFLRSENILCKLYEIGWEYFKLALFKEGRWEMSWNGSGQLSEGVKYHSGGDGRCLKDLCQRLTHLI